MKNQLAWEIIIQKISYRSVAEIVSILRSTWIKGTVFVESVLLLFERSCSIQRGLSILQMFEANSGG